MTSSSDGSPASAGANRRLHASSPLFTLLGNLKGWLIPLLLLLLFSKGDRFELWFMLLMIPGLAYELYRYFTVRYRFEGGDLVIRDGLLTRNERHIPVLKIQNLDQVQGPLMRLLSVAEVRIETASGSEPEAVLKVLKLDAVERMQSEVLARQAAIGGPLRVEAGEPPAKLLHELSGADLARLGVISNRGFAVILAALGLAWELELFDSLPDDLWLRPWQGQSTSWQLAALALLGTAAIVLLVALSILGTFARLAGYRLRQEGDDFRFSGGLFTRVSAAIPRRRIQLISVHENLRHRLFGCVTVRVETAGGVEQEDATLSRRWFVPLYPRERLAELLKRLHPGLSIAELAWQGLAADAARRMRRLRALIALGITGAAGWLWFPWGFLVGPVLLPLLCWMAGREARFRAFTRFPDGIGYRSGFLDRHSSFTFWNRLQVVSLRESPRDRRWRMAGVRVDTAGAGPAGHVIDVPHLTRQSAEALARDLAGSAQRAGFHW